MQEKSSEPPKDGRFGLKYDGNKMVKHPVISFSFAPWLHDRDCTAELECTTCTCPLLRVVKGCLLPALPAMLAKNTFSLHTTIFCRRGFKYFLSLSDLANRYLVKKCKLHNIARAKQVSTNKHRTETAERHPLTSDVSGRNFAI